MTKEQLDALALLLEQFVENYEDSHAGSLYGRKMDKALACDLRSAIVAYGAVLPNYTGRQP